MFDAFRMHTRTHIRFLVRSRLVIGFSIVFAVLWALGGVAFMLLDSSGDRFEMLKTISSQLRTFAWFYTAGMGLLMFWWHTNQRTTAVILTRPSPPEVWLASIFGCAMLAACAVQAAGLLLTVTLSLAWGVPLQSGFLWLTADAVLESVIMVSVLTGLAAVVHPVIAVIMVVFFSEAMFYSIDVMLLGYLQGRGDSMPIRMLEHVIYGIQTVLPMLDPFAHHTGGVESSLRATAADWRWLGATAMYSLIVFSFWFAFADLRLRRKLVA